MGFLNKVYLDIRGRVLLLKKLFFYPSKWVLLRLNLLHVHGPLDWSAEVSLFCLVRNGGLYLPSFFKHYEALGVQHFLFFVDESTDGTLELLKARSDTTIFYWKRPVSFSTYEHVLRRHLAYTYGRKRWVLYVDIDEQFDYPCSSRLPLGGLIGYLEGGNYNAVVGYMLDRFPSGPLQEQKDVSIAVLSEGYPWYDLTGLVRRPYRRRACRNKVFPHSDITDLLGGVREVFFASNPWLLKHPLARLDFKMRYRHHYLLGARIADFSSVLNHYCFLADLTDVAAHFVEDGVGYNVRRYQGVLERLESDVPLILVRESSRRLESVDQLVDEGFLCVSEAYLDWVERWPGV